ncbi:Nephrocystin-1 [Nymphon striatum]|nr:Nephrocystin-1 [Nymphon striatum]
MSLLEEAECFIRSNNTDANMSILFELCVSYVRPSTGEKGELSCGWVSQRLLDDTGLPVPNRTKDLYVNGGTPFEKGVEVDPSVAKKEASTTLRAIISKNRQPRVIFKIYGPSKEQKEQLDLLPDVIIGNMQLLPFFCIYRQLLADALLRDRIRAESSEKIHAPILSTFPSAVDQPDLMDAFRNAWADYQRTEKRITKAPAYLSDLLCLHKTVINIRRQVTAPLVEPRYQQQHYDKQAFSVAAPRFWNALPPTLRTIHRLKTFKTMLKTELKLS